MSRTRSTLALAAACVAALAGPCGAADSRSPGPGAFASALPTPSVLGGPAVAAPADPSGAPGGLVSIAVGLGVAVGLVGHVSAGPVLSVPLGDAALGPAVVAAAGAAPVPSAAPAP